MKYFLFLMVGILLLLTVLFSNENQISNENKTSLDSTQTHTYSFKNESYQ